jgi:hypothetical protein
MFMFAIRHRPSGLYIPRINSRGSTHHEPTAQLKTARLFHRERDAKGFLTTWLRGKQRQVEGPSSYESFTNDDVWVEVEPVPSRKRDEMEIVRLKFWEETFDDAE